MNIIEYREGSHRKDQKQMIDSDFYSKIIDVLPIVCVDVAITRDDQIFLTKRKYSPAQNYYWVQGGRIRKFESIEEAALRRVSEELKVPKDAISLVKNLGTFSTVFKDSFQGLPVHTINITFEGILKNGITPEIDGTHSDGHWFPVNGQKPDVFEDDFSHHSYIKQLLDLLAVNKGDIL